MAELYVRGCGTDMMPVSLEEAFPFVAEKRHVVSLVGAGGKTTLLYAMAEAASDLGHRVLVTTTTHFQCPDLSRRAYTLEDLECLWEQGIYGVIGTTVCGDKLSMPEENFFRQAQDRAEIVFIEADGARKLPCKAPESWEPVLLPECDIVVAVLGMDALGRPIRERCFRPERVAEICGKEDSEILRERDMAALFTDGNGLKKQVGERTYYSVLNKCDDEQRRNAAMVIAGHLTELGICNVVISCFHQTERQGGQKNG